MRSVVSPTLFCMMLLNCIVSAPSFAQDNGVPSEGKVSLTEGERAWLEEHPDIVMGYTDSFEPEVIVDPDGSLHGIQVDILDELNRRLGTRIRLRVAPVPELVEKAKKKEVDGILSLHPRYADKLGLLKTRTFLTNYAAVFARRDLPFDSPSDFSGKRVTIIDKAFFSEEIIEEYGQGATILKVKDSEEGMQIVSKNQADYFLGATLNAYLLVKYQLFDMTMQYVFYDDPIEAVMATRSDWPEFSSIVNKGLSSFPEEEIEAIVAKWIHLPKQQQVLVDLTPEELRWLAQNHTVRVFATAHAPLLFYKDGKPVGISADFLNEVSRRTGIKFEISKPSQDFTTAMKGLIAHEGPDLIAGLDPTPERERVILFSRTYWSSPKFIFTRDDAPFVSSIEDLSGRRIAVVGGYVTHELLKKIHPDVNLLVYRNNKDALSAVSAREAFAFIGSLAATSAMMNAFGLTNLKACAPSSLPDATVAMGIRSDWPELRDIINNVLDSIPAAKKAAIVNRWSSVKFEHGIRLGDVLKWGVGVACGTLCIGFLFIFWNRSLARKVKERTLELERATKSLENDIIDKIKAEQALKDSWRYTDNLIETANVMIVGLDAKGNVTTFNPAAEKVTGYTRSEMIGRNWLRNMLPPDEYPTVEREFVRLMSGGLPRLFENTILTKKGRKRFISWSNNEVTRDGQVVGAISFGIDVTERKKAEDALKESEEQFRHLVEQSPMSIQTMSPDGRITKVNRAFMDLWGVTEDSLRRVLGKYNILEDEQARELGVMPHIKKAFSGEAIILPVIEYDGSSTMGLVGLPDVNAKRVWIQARLYPVKNSRGEVVSVVQIEEDVTERKKAEQKVQDYQQRLKTLLSQLAVTEERERRRIAADLHDHVGQSLAFARIQLAAARKSTSLEKRNAILDDTSETLLHTIQDTKNLIFELSVPSMNELGLGAAISDWLEEQLGRRYGLKTAFIDEIDVSLRKTLDDDVRAILFRNVRELLANVVKHAHANQVRVSMAEADGFLEIVVHDDGVGFEAREIPQAGGKKGGYGLFSIEERMTDLGGSLEIVSEPGKGCKAVLTVPLGEGRTGVLE